MHHKETKADQLKAKKEAVKQQKQRDSAAAVELEDSLHSKLKRAVQISSEKRVLSWLATLHVAKHGFALHRLRSANREDGDRLDISAVNLCRRDCEVFDVRVFSPFTQSHWNTSLSQCYKKIEQEKNRAYDQCIREVEYGSSSRLVLFHIRRNGANCQCCLQKNKLHDSREAQDKQQDPLLDQVQAELLTAALCNCV